MFNGYQLFKIYHSLHLHFTSKYDFIKYGDRSKAVAFGIYEKRKDKLMFETIAKKLPNAVHAFEFCLANFIHNVDHWIYEDFPTSDSIYREWRVYFDTFDNRFKREYKILEEILNEKHTTFKTILQPTKSWNQPPLLQLLLHKRFTPEFVCRLDEHFNFVVDWMELYEGIDPFVEKKLFILMKYKPFVKLLSKEQKRSEL